MQFNYAIRHTTRFTYSQPISENVMEVRKMPRNDLGQQPYRFQLSTYPRSKVFQLKDEWGNSVHYFNINPPHNRLEIIADSVVGVTMEPIPAVEMTAAVDWPLLEGLAYSPELWDFLNPSHFVEKSAAVQGFLEQIGLPSDHLPYATAQHIMETIFDRFEYRQNTTRVDSRVEELLELGAGVCQDFTHLMIGTLRILGIPARYVSGYLMHREGGEDRSAEDASHAWVEGYFPTLGWIGFDPTNRMLARERHIRVAIGRDYADVTPTRGMFKGTAESKLEVGVDVKPVSPPQEEPEPNLTHSEWVLAGERNLTVQEQQQ